MQRVSKGEQASVLAEESSQFSAKGVAVRRRTPEDFAALNARLVRFWEQYGEAIDYAIIVLCIAACAWSVGYSMGLASR